MADRAFTSTDNRRHLQRGGNQILGEKLRGGSSEAVAALSSSGSLKRAGRYKTVADNVRVKEVIVGDGTMTDRFVACHNPEESDRDPAVRQRIVAGPEQAISGSDQLAATKRTELYRITTLA